MRWLVAVVAVLMLPVVGAQAVLEDPEGDHQAGFTPMDSQGEPVQWMDAQDFGWYPYVDVLSMGVVEETEEDLILEARIQEDAAGVGEPRDFRGAAYLMPFTWAGEEFAFEFTWYKEDDVALFRLSKLQTEDFGDFSFTFHRTQYIGSAEPLDEPGWRASIPKDRIRDDREVPIRAGDVLEGLHVEAEARSNSHSSPCLVFQHVDCWRARDIVEGQTDYEVQVNARGVGHLHMDSDAPYRGSNGQATTYLFNLTLLNLGDVEDRVLIQVGDQPEDWTVRAPSTLQLEANGTLRVPVAVSVPFKHVHGQQETMQVRATSTREPGIEAIVEVGVVWHDVPQPGGHHPDLYLHSGSSGGGWMNTLAEDPDEDGDGELRWNFRGSTGGASGFDHTIGYRLRLSPALQMGLDFERGGSIPFEAGLRSASEQDGTLTAELSLSGQEGQVLASGETPFSVAEGKNPFALTLDLADGVDRFPYLADRNLELSVAFSWHEEAGVPGGFLVPDTREWPTLLTDGASLRLPLEEYHEVIDEELLSSLARLSLRAEGPAEKLVNPGKTAVFPFRVANADERAEEVSWSLQGTNTAWASVAPAATQVGAGRNATVVVAVAVPEDAREGQVADLLLIGQSGRDEHVQVFGHVAATVTTEEEVPDQADEAAALSDEARRSAAKDAPAVPAAVLLVAIAAALARRR